MAIKIVTDSSAGLTEDEIKDLDITIIPLSVMIDDTIYIERETITNEEFYNKMIASKSLPKTSQPPLGTFVETFDKLGEDGSSVLSINMLAAISGTVNTAGQAANLSKTDVTVVDSGTTDRALAFQVIAAAKMAQKGASMDDIVAKIKEIGDNTRLFMGVVTLENLTKGGRLNRVAGAISSMLNIKIVLQVKDGDLNVVAKGRGMKTLDRYFDGVYNNLEHAENVESIGVSYVGDTDTAEKMRTRVQTMYPDKDVVVRETVPIIATHGGPGAFCLMYYTDTDPV